MSNCEKCNTDDGCECQPIDDISETRISNEFEPIPERAKKLTADEIAAYGKGRGLFGKRRQL